MINIKDLHIHFGDKKVLKGVNLHIDKNSIFGFVGKNGAGKTTTMKAILGLLSPNQGQILIDGVEVTFGGEKTNKYIGYLYPKRYNKAINNINKKRFLLNILQLNKFRCVLCKRKVDLDNSFSNFGHKLVCSWCLYTRFNNFKSYREWAESND